MLTRFQLTNFKAHRDTALDLEQLTLFVGDNASGKTSVLEALALQSALALDPFQSLEGARDPHDLLRRGATQPLFAFTSEAQLTKEVHFELQVPHSKPWELTVYYGKSSLGSFVEGGQIAGGDWLEIRRVVRSARLYSLRAERIAETSISDQQEVVVGLDGKNTAAVLAALKLENDEAFDAIEQALCNLVPSVKRLRIKRSKVEGKGNRIGEKIYFDFESAPGIPAHGASHGTLLVLALLTILYSPQRPDLVLLDDFDHALHPRAQLELLRMIKKLLALPEFGELQIIATTHSPYVVDEVDPRAVHAFALRNDGTVASRRLSEHPSAERMKGTLTSGQLWSLDSEKKWVLQDSER